MKRLLLALSLLLLAAAASARTTTMLNGATALGYSPIVYMSQYATSVNRTFQATELCTGMCSATVNVYGSNDGVGWIQIGTITLNGTSTPPLTDGFNSNAAWSMLQVYLSAISGTGATVTVTLGAQ